MRIQAIKADWTVLGEVACVRLIRIQVGGEEPITSVQARRLGSHDPGKAVSTREHQFFLGVGGTQGK